MRPIKEQIEISCNAPKQSAACQPFSNVCSYQFCLSDSHISHKNLFPPLCFPVAVTFPFAAHTRKSFTSSVRAASCFVLPPFLYITHLHGYNFILLCDVCYHAGTRYGANLKIIVVLFFGNGLCYCVLLLWLRSCQL